MSESHDDTNPYSPPHASSDVPIRSAKVRLRWKLAKTGAIWSLLSAFPIAGLMTLTCGFPVVMVGFVWGFKALAVTMKAVVFYGIFLGGFIVLPVLGAIGGALTPTFIADSNKHKRMTRIIALGATSTCLFVLWFLQMLDSLS